MKQTSVQTDLLGSSVSDGEHNETLANRQLAYYGLSSPATVRAVFIDREGSLKLLVVDSEGRSAEIYPCQVKIWSPTHETQKSE